jgi:tetratricopeptide (TPR) repeat protein
MTAGQRLDPSELNDGGRAAFGDGSMKFHWMAGLAAAGLGMLLATGNVAVAQGKKKERKQTNSPPPKPGNVQPSKGKSSSQPRKKTTTPPKTTFPPQPKVFGQPKTGTKQKSKTGVVGQPQKGQRPPISGKNPPVTIGKKRPPVVIGKKRPVGTLPGLGKRPRTGVGATGLVVGGRHTRLPVSGAARAAELQRRNLALRRQLRVAPANRVAALRVRRDWQVWNGGYYGRYSWIRGYWGSPWLARWDSYWARRWLRRYPLALGFGTTWWGLNRVGYQFGYYPYDNPYAGDPVALGGGVMCDYSQPLVQPMGGDAQGQESQSSALARKAFMERNYRLALSDVNDALKDAPQDAALQEFRALVLFAMGDYKGAAAPLDGVLAVGPGWDWKTIRGLYPDGATYTKQLRALEKFVANNPKDAAGHFVLGYHYVGMGYAPYAVKQFQQATDLEPKDAVSRQMVTMLTKGAAKDDPNEADNEPPLPGGTAAGAGTPAGTSAVTLEKLTGNWTAKRGKETFNLVMTKEDRFTWTHTDATGKKTVMKGGYALEKGALALEMDAGGVMLANVSLPTEKELKFRMVNDENKDPGLTFIR